MSKYNRVLLVDDDPTTNFLNKLLLDEMEIARDVIIRTNGVQALRYIREHCINEQAPDSSCPDLIFLDLNMPEMSGIEFLEELHQLEQHNLITTKVIVLTSSAHSRDIEKVKALGVQTHLIKPLSEEELNKI